MPYEVHHGRVVRCIADRPANLGEMLAAAVARAPQEDAIVDRERRLTYAELDAAVQSLASACIGMGLQRGDRVAVLLDNRLEFPVIVLACAVAGLIAVPLNVRQSISETSHALNACGAKVLFHEATALLPDTAATPLLKRFVVADNVPLPAAPPQNLEAVNEDDAAIILFTSGTTGKPKGAVLTHCNLIHSLLHFRHHYALRDGERCLLAVPASHVTGLVALIGVSVELAGCLIIMRAFKADAFVRLAAQERMTYTLIVPAMLALATRQPDFDSKTLGHWRVCGFGGAPMPDAMIAEIDRKLPSLALHNTYGATETTSPAVIMPAGEAAARPRQLGLPVICCDLLILDADGREVAPGEQGEIWMAGPMVSPGYWDDPRATETEFCHGFWKSGDIGSRDADGYVSIHDRIKDMVNRGGFKIYSVEVENALCTHPAVIEAAVVGKPCPVLGERVVAFVHLCDQATAQDLRDHVAASLSDYKVPEQIVVELAALPRNANGKLLKRSLRERAAKL